MADSIQDTVARTREYQDVVLAYEQLDAQIDQLLSSVGGASRNLSDKSFAQYRELVALRDLAYNQMKTLEQTLLDE